MHDVCLIVEGAYPRVRGGVAEWVQQLTSTLPDLSFSVVSLTGESVSDLKPAYRPAANVEVLELPFEHARPDQTRELEALLPEAAVYHAASTGAAGVLGARVAKARGRGSVLTEHAVAWEEARRSKISSCRGGIHGRADLPALDQVAWYDLHRGLAVEAYEGAHAVTGVSPSTVRLQRSLGASARLLQNGVTLHAAGGSTAGAAAGSAAVPAPLGPRVGFVGRVDPVKDVVTFLRACRLVADEVPGAEFAVVGPLHHSPLYAERCIEEARTLGLGASVMFTGEADPQPWYATFDALVLTSVSEAQPLVLLEAMAAGVPVVSTAVGGCPELLAGAGLLTPVGDPRATARAVTRLLSDRDLHATLAAAGKARAHAAHGVERMAAQYEALYRSVAEPTTRV